MFSIPRTTLARHREHVQPLLQRFGVIRGNRGPDGPPDPLAEALQLAARAKTPRERLRALEQVRGATRLLLRGNPELDEHNRALLDQNVRSAEEAYVAAGDFETAARALSGLREALLQRLVAQPAAQAIEVPIVLTSSDGSPVRTDWLGSADATMSETPEQHWRGVPVRFRTDLHVVQRVIHLELSGPGRTEVKIVDRASGVLVWATDA
jgi:hypothetical protein